MKLQVIRRGEVGFPGSLANKAENVVAHIDEMECQEFGRNEEEALCAYVQLLADKRDGYLNDARKVTRAIALVRLRAKRKGFDI